MAAGPQNGTIVIVGRQTGRVFRPSIYCSDVAGALVTFGLAAKATSTDPNYWTAPENCNLVDLSLTADLTDCKTLQIAREGNPTGDYLLTTQQVYSVTTRALMNVMIARGIRLQIYQRA